MDKGNYRRFASDREIELIALYRAKNYSEFLERSEQADESWLLMYYRALCMWNGKGTQQNLPDARMLMNRALNSILLAAREGNAWAQHCLGFLYSDESDTFLTHDLSQSARWYEMAAQQGFVDSQFNLANMYMKGRGVERDVMQAVKWYRKAGELGDADAQRNLGWIYANGHGIEQNDTEAVVWFRKAADCGMRDAQFNLGLMYDEGRGVKRDYSQAAVWYRKAADQGFADAQFNLGLMYEEGRGVEHDASKAAEWYRLAAEQGDAEAQYNLGNAYVNGLGVVVDENEAMKWFQKAEANGYDAARDKLEALRRLAEIRESEKAVISEIVSKAESGSVDAQILLAQMYEEGKGVMKDQENALRWYRRAADQGHDGAKQILAIHDKLRVAESNLERLGVELGELKRQVDDLAAKAESGDVVSQFGLGQCYENGTVVEKNEMLAAKWYRRAAEAGCADACYSLAQLYLSGKGVEKDRLEANCLFRRAATGGNLEAQRMLGLVYAFGLIGYPTDMAEALGWLKMAASQDDVLSICLVGAAYEGGEGVVRNIHEANRWYAKLQKMGTSRDEVVKKIEDAVTKLKDR